MDAPSPAAGGPTTARVFLEPHFAVGEVNPRLFGSFLEHLGRAVYTGVFEPDHPAAGPGGLRTDVLALVRELGTTMVRYPGGNFVSGYRWEDGIGPVAERPRRLDLAWRTTEPNRFGLDEFMTFATRAGLEPMLAVNLGTRGVTEACDLLEYANHPGGTRWSELRRTHGAKAPYGIRLWCLGNELDGDWQIGHKTADEYGRLAAQTAKAMRMLDPDVQLVACGSSGRGMPTFGAWEATVLEHGYDVFDFISCHAYYQEFDDDVDSFLASAADMEAFIDGTIATCDHVKAKLKSDRTINISFDEWNVWYMRGPARASEPEQPWQVAPRLLEDHYSVTDAVVVGSLLITLLRHCDRVTAACIAQLVNVIAPIMTEPGGPAWRQTTFYPFADAARHGRGLVLRLATDCPEHDTAAYGRVPLLHATAVAGEDGATTVFAVNRDPARPMLLTADLRALGPVGAVEHQALSDPDRHARNTLTEPDRVTPRTVAGATIDGGQLQVELPPLSWNTIRLHPAR